MAIHCISLFFPLRSLLSVSIPFIHPYLSPSSLPMVSSQGRISDAPPGNFARHAGCLKAVSNPAPASGRPLPPCVHLVTFDDDLMCVGLRCRCACRVPLAEHASPQCPRFRTW
eukprot:23830-Rhodomonas_salina.2